MSTYSEKVNHILESYEIEYKKEEEERILMEENKKLLEAEKKLLEIKREEELRNATDKLIEESKPYWEAGVLFQRKNGTIKEHKILCPECSHDILSEHSLKQLSKCNNVIKCNGCNCKTHNVLSNAKLCYINKVRQQHELADAEERRAKRRVEELEKKKKEIEEQLRLLSN